MHCVTSRTLWWQHFTNWASNWWTCRRRRFMPRRNAKFAAGGPMGWRASLLGRWWHQRSWWGLRCGNRMRPLDEEAPIRCRQINGLLRGPICNFPPDTDSSRTLLILWMGDERGTRGASSIGTCAANPTRLSLLWRSSKGCTRDDGKEVRHTVRVEPDRSDE